MLSRAETVSERVDSVYDDDMRVVSDLRPESSASYANNVLWRDGLLEELGTATKSINLSEQIGAGMKFMD